MKNPSLYGLCLFIQELQKKINVLSKTGTL